MKRLFSTVGVKEQDRFEDDTLVKNVHGKDEMNGFEGIVRRRIVCTG